MSGFEPRTSGIGSNRSTNWATTTARYEPLAVALLNLTADRYCEWSAALQMVNADRFSFQLICPLETKFQANLIFAFRLISFCH